jgi:hypothetical protein
MKTIKELREGLKHVIRNHGNLIGHVEKRTVKYKNGNSKIVWDAFHAANGEARSGHKTRHDAVASVRTMHRQFNVNNYNRNLDRLDKLH